MTAKIINFKIGKGRKGDLPKTPAYLEVPSEVIDLEEERLKNMAHISGPAVCIRCDRKWVAVAPAGTVGLQCPGCLRITGGFRDMVVPKETFDCPCGNTLFLITPTEIVCSLCGLPAKLDPSPPKRKG